MTTVSIDHSAAAAKLLPEPALFIGGERITHTPHGTRDRIDPATGEVLASFPVAGAEEVDQAVQAAKKAFPAWKRLPADKRRTILWDMAQAVAAHASDLRGIYALETGLAISSTGVNSVIDTLEFYAGYCDKFEGELIAGYPNPSFDYVKYEPYGVIGCLPTYNAPVAVTAMKLGPALAAGNTVVAKCPDLGPFAIMRLWEIFAECGLPEGVINLVAGNRYTTQAIVAHRDVRKVSFTGGPETAKALMALAAESLTPLTLELGGKSANVIFDDADLSSAAQMAAVMSTIALNGQGCLFPSRVLIQDTVYEEVLARIQSIVEAVGHLGDPLDPTTVVGPVVDDKAATRILGMIDRAKAESRLVCGGERATEAPLERGYFIKPTVFADVDPMSELAQHEVFGPVLAATPFSTEAEAVEIANCTEYGLAAYVHTNDLRRAIRMADNLEAGYIGVNGFPAMQAAAPFGGVKGSGFGREGGRAGIEEFVHHKSVFIPMGGASPSHE